MPGKGPVEKLGYTSQQLADVGNLTSALKQAKLEAKEVQREFDAAAKAGKQVSTELYTRRKQAEMQIQALQRQASQAQAISSAASQAKFAKGMLQAGSVQRLLSGSASFSDIASLIDSNKVEKLVTSTFQKMGMQNVGALLGRALPIGGIAGELTGGIMNALIQNEQLRQKASAAMAKTFDRDLPADITRSIRNRIEDDVRGDPEREKLQEEIDAEDIEISKRVTERFEAIKKGRKIADELGITEKRIKETAMLRTGKSADQLTNRDLMEARDARLSLVKPGKVQRILQAKEDDATAARDAELDMTPDEQRKRDFLKNNTEFVTRDFKAFRAMRDLEASHRASLQKTEAHNDD